MNIAIFPGTFSPIHIGHLMIAESAAIQFNLDKVLFVISPNPPNKLNSNEIIALDTRIKLLKIALENNSKFELELTELKRQGPSYTIHTIQEIKERENLKSTETINLIIGADSFLTLPHWHQAIELQRHCQFLLAPRPGFNEKQEQFAAFHRNSRWKLIDCPPLEISSKEIRRRKAAGKSYRYLLPEKVFELIKDYQF